MGPTPPTSNEVDGIYTFTFNSAIAQQTEIMPDTDNDTLVDSIDNCVEAANVDQRDFVVTAVVFAGALLCQWRPVVRESTVVNVTLSAAGLRNANKVAPAQCGPRL